MKKLIESAVGERKKVRFEDADNNEFANMIKIEAKKNQQMRKKKAKELKSIKAKNKQAESQKALT